MLLLYSLATLAGGAGYYPWSRWPAPRRGLVLLLVTRLLAGAGIGAENVVIDAYVTEVMPRQVRGRAIALTPRAGLHRLSGRRLLADCCWRRNSPATWWLLLRHRVAGGPVGLVFSPQPAGVAALVGRRRPRDEAAATLAKIEAAVQNADRPASAAVDRACPASVEPDRPFAKSGRLRYRGRTVLADRLPAFANDRLLRLHALARQAVCRPRAVRTDDALDDAVCASSLAPVGPLLGIWSSERWQRKWLIVVLARVAGRAAERLASRRAVALTVVAAALIVCRLQLVLGRLSRLPGRAVSHRGTGHRRRLHLRLEPSQHGRRRPGYAGTHRHPLAGRVRTDGGVPLRRRRRHHHVRPPHQ